LVFCLACHGAGGGQLDTAIRGDLTIAMIAAEPARYIGRVVTLPGVFLGWQAGECRFPANIASRPRTRSDWLIRTGADCLYVTAGKPPGLDPTNPDHIGRRVVLESREMQAEGGGLYLEYRGNKAIDTSGKMESRNSREATPMN
jgi:hypothetical protein